MLPPNEEGPNQPAYNQPQDERYRAHANVTDVQNPRAWRFRTLFPGCSGGQGRWATKFQGARVT